LGILFDDPAVLFFITLERQHLDVISEKNGKADAETKPPQRLRNLAAVG
jgi:hypothetical protein